jgi:hypothetical protein
MASAGRPYRTDDDPYISVPGLPSTRRRRIDVRRRASLYPRANRQTIHRERMRPLLKDWSGDARDVPDVWSTHRRRSLFACLVHAFGPLDRLSRCTS